MSTNIDQILQQQSSSFSPTESSVGFMQRVYAWMMGGLLISALMAFVATSSETAFATVLGLRPILLIAQIGLVFWLSMRLDRMAVSTAYIVFVVYSALVGLTMSAIIAFYSPESVMTTFVSTAGMFGVMSLYGMTTKRDLSSIGSFLMMGVVGLLIVMVVNMFLQSSELSFAISAVGVLVFVGLTAWDTQKIKALHAESLSGEAAAKMSIMGALNLYLDFINMFLFLLRLLGRRR